jgi:hypothetical protein
MPRMTRVPKNGGAGTSTSRATSERTESSLRSGSDSLTIARWRSRRSRRAASAASRAGSTIGASPRLAAITRSISDSPSNASRA